jgi:hypothetical protein
VSKKPSREQREAPDAPPAEIAGAMLEDAGIGVSNDPEESRADEVPDPLSGPVFGPTLLEQLLQGIIAAHPVSAKTDRERLNAAMKALVGHKSSGSLFAGDPDERALLWMKRQQLDRRRSEKMVSDRSLAIEAATKFSPSFNAGLDMSPADRLREKFSGVYDKKKATAQSKISRNPGMPADVPRTLAYRVAQHDHLAESIETQILRRVANELRNAGVGVSLPDD